MKKQLKGLANQAASIGQALGGTSSVFGGALVGQQQMTTTTTTIDPNQLNIWGGTSISGTGAHWPTTPEPPTPSERLRHLEFNLDYTCKFCGNYDPNMADEILLEGLPASMLGHLEDCRYVLEIKPRIAFLDLGGTKK